MFLVLMWNYVSVEEAASLNNRALAVVLKVNYSLRACL